MKTAEQIYNSVPLCEKENAKLPYRYYELSVDQKFFVDRLVELSYNNTDYTDLIDNLEFVKEEVEQMIISVKDS